MFDMVLNTYLYSTLESNRFNLNLVVEFCPTLGAFKKIYEKMIAIKLILIVIEVFSRYLFFFFFQKCTFMDVWHGPKYVSVFHSRE